MLMRVVNPEIERSSRRQYDIGAAVIMAAFTLMFAFVLVVSLANPEPPERFVEQIEAGL